ncbi:tetratricopeptide repeat protein [bacterium]|nr:tetratricopeptide repeat protein [bacterium]MBP9806832.1 tetratricopeptide repeat protein [bacterium]
MATSKMQASNRIRLALTLAILLCLGVSPATRAIDSIAEAYLVQGKREYEKGNYAAAKRLFNKAAYNADNIYKDKLYVAAIYQNAAEAYKQLIHVNRDYSDNRDDNLAVAFLSKKLEPLNPRQDADVDSTTPDETRAREVNEKLTSVAYPNVPIASSEKIQWIAVHYLRLSLQIKELTLGTNSVPVANSMETLALLYEEFNTQLEEAEALMRKAIEIRKSVEGKNNPNCAISYSSLAKIMKTSAESHADYDVKVAKLKDSVEAYKTSLAILNTNKLSKSNLAGQNLGKLSLIHYDKPLRNFPASIIEFEQAYDILSIDKGHQKEFKAFQQEHYKIAELALDSARQKFQAASEKSTALKTAAARVVLRSAKRADNQNYVDAFSSCLKDLTSKTKKK